MSIDMNVDRDTATAAMTDSDSIQPPLVGAITVNWNGLSDTLECLDSLRNQTYRNLHVVVVDNCSEGNEAERIREAHGDFATVIRTERNLGSAGGFNAGIKHMLTRARPDYFLIVNNDISADVDMVERLVETMRSHPETGIVGPKIYYKDYHGRSDVLWSAGGVINRWGLKIHRQLGQGADDRAEFNSEREVDWISGAAFLFTHEVLRDVGYLNTWYFVGHEDIEFCLKATAAGHRVVYAPRARAWHAVGASARKLSITYADPGAYYYLIRRVFPTHVYLYHLALFPLLLARWGILFAIRIRNAGALRRFAGDLRGFVTGRRPNAELDASVYDACTVVSSGPGKPESESTHPRTEGHASSARLPGNSTSSIDSI